MDNKRVAGELLRLAKNIMAEDSDEQEKVEEIKKMRGSVSFNLSTNEKDVWKKTGYEGSAGMFPGTDDVLGDLTEKVFGKRVQVGSKFEWDVNGEKVQMLTPHVVFPQDGVFEVIINFNYEGKMDKKTLKEALKSKLEHEIKHKQIELTIPAYHEYVGKGSRPLMPHEENRGQTMTLTYKVFVNDAFVLQSGSGGMWS